MKRLIFFSFAAIVFIASYCYWLLSPPKEQSAPELVKNTEIIEKVVQVTTGSPTSEVSKFTKMEPGQPLTIDRRRILDAPDIMRAIEEIRRGGTQDEKNWAYSLLTTCNQLLKHDFTLNTPDIASSPTVEAIVAKKKQATDLLAKRCDGVKNLNSTDNQALQAELFKARENNPSILGQLEEFGSSEDSRWSSQQAQLITNSLYSGDPIVAKAAFLAVMRAFDRNAPGGEDRLSAFSFALAPIYLNFPLSTYEQLQTCRSNGWCNGTYEVPPEPIHSPEELRLIKAYKSASDSHADVRSILAIR